LVVFPLLPRCCYVDYRCWFPLFTLLRYRFPVVIYVVVVTLLLALLRLRYVVTTPRLHTLLLLLLCARLLRYVVVTLYGCLICCCCYRLLIIVMLYPLLIRYRLRHVVDSVVVVVVDCCCCCCCWFVVVVRCTLLVVPRLLLLLLRWLRWLRLRCTLLLLHVTLLQRCYPLFCPDFTFDLRLICVYARLRFVAVRSRCVVTFTLRFTHHGSCTLGCCWFYRCRCLLLRLIVYGYRCCCLPFVVFPLLYVYVCYVTILWFTFTVYVVRWFTFVTFTLVCCCCSFTLRYVTFYVLMRYVAFVDVCILLVLHVTRCSLALFYLRCNVCCCFVYRYVALLLLRLFCGYPFRFTTLFPHVVDLRFHILRLLLLRWLRWSFTFTFCYALRYRCVYVTLLFTLLRCVLFNVYRYVYTTRLRCYHRLNFYVTFVIWLFTLHYVVYDLRYRCVALRCCYVYVGVRCFDLFHGCRCSVVVVSHSGYVPHLRLRCTFHVVALLFDCLIHVAVVSLIPRCTLLVGGVVVVTFPRCCCCCSLILLRYPARCWRCLRYDFVVSLYVLRTFTLLLLLLRLRSCYRCSFHTLRSRCCYVWCCLLFVCYVTVRYYLFTLLMLLYRYVWLLWLLIRCSLCLLHTFDYVLISHCTARCWFCC